MKSTSTAVIIATGSYLPKKIVTNDDLSKTLDTSDSWIFPRTGIKARHIACDTETTTFMGAQAALSALRKARKNPNQIDGIIVATTTPDNTFPSVATKIQAILNACGAFAFDVQAVCSGFIYALNIARSMIISGSARNLLVVGAESMSKLVDWSDRNTAVLFGDGAGAVIVSAKKSKTRGILASCIESDGRFENILHTTGGPASTQTAGHISMNGREVFKIAVEKMAYMSEKVLKKAGIKSKEVDWVIPHQANLRIMSAVMNRLNMPEEKLLLTIAQHANTSAASIPIVMDHYSKKIKRGDLVLITAVGGGLTWGASLIRW